MGSICSSQRGHSGKARTSIYRRFKRRTGLEPHHTPNRDLSLPARLGIATFTAGLARTSKVPKCRNMTGSPLGLWLSLRSCFKILRAYKNKNLVQYMQCSWISLDRHGHHARARSYADLVAQGGLVNWHFIEHVSH